MEHSALCCYVSLLVVADLVLLWLRVEPFVADTRSFSFWGNSVVSRGGTQCRRTMNLVRFDEGYHSRSTAQIKERLV